MATLYLKTAGGNSSLAATWSNVSSAGVDNSGPPGAGDDVILELASGNLTINGNLICKSFSCIAGTGNYTGTITQSTQGLQTNGGSLTFSSGMTYTPTSASSISINGTCTLTTAGKLLPTLNHTLGNLTLGDNLSFTAIKTNALNLSSSGTFDMNGKSINGNSTINRILIKSSVLGSPKIITNATTSFTNADFRDITFSSASDLNLSGISGLSGDCLGNSITGGGTILTFTTGVPQFYFNNTGSWSDATKWFTATNGGGSAGRVPLPQDDATFNTNSTNTTGQTLTVDMPRIGKSILIDPTAANNPTINFSIVNEIYGSLDLRNKTYTFTHTNTTNFVGRSSFIFRGRDGSSISGPFTVNMIGGTLTSPSRWALASLFTLTNGTVNLGTGITNHTFNGGLTVSSGTTFNFNSSSIVLGVNSTLCSFASGTVNAGSGNITISNISSSNKNFIGGGNTFNNITITGGATGIIIIQNSNTFGVFTITAPMFVRFTSGTTQTVSSFVATGTAGNIITIDTQSAGNFATISQSSGIVSCNYLSLKDNHAVGGATFYAGANSTNVSGNSGWFFTGAIYSESLSYTIVGTTSLSDLQTYKELLNTTLVTTISETDRQTYKEALSFLITCVTTLSDLQSYKDNLSFIIASIVSEQDYQTYKEALSFIIQSQITLTDAASYLENLNFSIVSSMTINDIKNILENLDIVLSSQISITDKQSYIDNLNLILTIVIQIAEVYSFLLKDFKPIYLKRNSLTKVKSSIQEPIKFYLRRKNWS